MAAAVGMFSGLQTFNTSHGRSGSFYWIITVDDLNPYMKLNTVRSSEIETSIFQNKLYRFFYEKGINLKVKLIGFFSYNKCREIHYNIG